MPLSTFSSMAHQNFTNKNQTVNFIKNYNFLLPNANIWTTQGIITIENGTGGGYGFVNCPYPKFVVNQAYTGYPAGIMSQTISLLSTSYVLSFWAAVRPNAAYNTSHQFSVVIDTTTYFTSTFTGSNTSWVQYFVYYSVSSSGNHTLNFNFTTAGGADSSIGITQILTNCSFVNYNFALPAQAANTYANYDIPNTINNWTHYGVMRIANGTGGGFGFTTCPFGQFLINQCYTGTYSGSISQSVYLSATSYTFSFRAAVRPGGYTTVQQLSILIDDTTCYTSSFTTSSTTWTQYTFNFTVQKTGYHSIYINFVVPDTVAAGLDTSIGITQLTLYHNDMYNPLSTGQFVDTSATYSGQLLRLPTIASGIPSSSILTDVYTTITGINNTQSFMNGTYVAKDSGNYGTVWTAFNLFNNSTETGFHSPAATYSLTDGTYYGSKSQTISGTVVLGEWMTIQFPYKFILTSYTVIIRTGYYGRAPSTWKIGGSNDGVTWTLLDAQTNITTVVNTFSVSTAGLYSNYVIVISKIVGGDDGFLNFAEWVIYGTKQIDNRIIPPLLLQNQISATALSTLRCLYTLVASNYRYNGPVVNVRRASDNATSDFYADYMGNIGQGANGTGTTLSSWLTSTTGYVTKWYDQSGLANHLVQSNTSYQPQIILNDAGGICLYLNISTGTGSAYASQMQTINNVFSTSTVVDAHIFIISKSLTYTQNTLFSLNSPIGYSGISRFGGHIPFSDGTYYFDAGDGYTGRVTSTANLIPAGFKTYFGGYKQSSTTTEGFSVNGYVYSGYAYSANANPTATVGYLGLNYADGTVNTNHYMYGFSVFSKSLYSTTDERLMRFLNSPSQYLALYNIYLSKNPWGIYDANQWNSTTNTLPEARGNGRDVTTSGTVTKSNASGNGAAASITYLGGTTSTVLTWPSGSIPTNFTICSITRYSGTSKYRILNGSSNWLHGHHSDKRGVCYYDGWKTNNTTSVGTQTDWLVCCGKNSGSTPNNILIDGVPSGTATGGSSNLTLYINNGTAQEPSDFQMSYVIIWDQILTDAEMQTTSTALQYYLSSGIPLESTPTNLDGLTAVTAAPSAVYLVAKGNTTNGVYWINLPTVGPTQIYCILDTAVDGGGWMMAMKATRGTTFPYSSTYWTANNTLNTFDTTRSDGDAKFNTMNYYPAKDMLALWPDITATGGSLTLSSYGCWCWEKTGVIGSQTLINYFSTTAANTVFDSNPRAGKERGSIFSSQAGNQFYGINYNLRGGDEVRWGFAWNNETDWNSNDVRGGIGLAANNYSAGDNIGCCQDNTGINRSARVEIYIR